MDGDGLRTTFAWEDARSAELHPLDGERINIFHEAVGHHVEEGRGQDLAIRWLGRDGSTRDLTFADLDDLAGRFAGVLRDLGVGRGDRVFTLLGRVPDLYVAALGALRNGSVFCPLFSAFGPEPVRSRVGPGKGRVLVTTAQLYERKVAPVRAELPDLEHVLLVGEGTAEGCIPLAPLMETATPAPTVPMDPEEMALLHFTSGTTGRPKGAVHVHAAVLAHRMTGRWVLDLHAGDVFWCTADPGWVTGTSYGIVAPLALGATLVVDEADFDGPRWLRILEEQRVAVWYTAPTAIRMLMKLTPDQLGEHDLSSVRHACSVGEPLAPDGVAFGETLLGTPFHDTWWQSETGAIMIANLPGAPVRPGSMGRPVPGVVAAVVERTEGGVRPIDTPDVEGELALRAGWPSMFRMYLDNPERYGKSFADGWYLSGDLARRDADGFFWFVGRADDVFKSAGHLIGPFEVESALVEHPDVAEAAVIGKPDPIAGSIVKAFLVLRPGVEGDAGVERSIRAHARKRLGPAVAPREITFVDHLPHTRSGKVMRRLLKARELGLPEGDTSTLENP
ncbi:MAG: acetate--CoA ligase [Alphaproteobacteria bacterium]|nr:acetate--CoA ligase [Alphaproteobacteria bacterium]